MANRLFSIISYKVALPVSSVKWTFHVLNANGFVIPDKTAEPEQRIEKKTEQMMLTITKLFSIVKIKPGAHYLKISPNVADVVIKRIHTSLLAGSHFCRYQKNSMGMTKEVSDALNDKEDKYLLFALEVESVNINLKANEPEVKPSKTKICWLMRK